MPSAEDYAEIHGQAGTHDVQRMAPGEGMPKPVKRNTGNAGKPIDESRKVRILAHAVQNYGANPEDAKAALDDPNVGMDHRQNDRTLGRATALYANTKGGRHSR